MYKLLYAAASRLGTPYARRLSTNAIKLAAAVAPTGLPQHLQRKVMGLTFPGPIGLAAGFDKHGELYPALFPLGFGFAEIGSVIPLPEPQRSHGLNAVTAILEQHPRPHPAPLGVSVSMNRMTPAERMADDYLACIERLWKYADYFAINLGISAGPDLHLPENHAILRSVLESVKNARSRIGRSSGLYRPMLVKVDRNRGDTDSLLACVQEFSFDGLILSGDANKGEEHLTLAKLEQVASAMNGQMPIISVGGIRTPQDAADRLSAGAALVQVYSGIVESGPMLPRRINEYLSNSAAAS
ncbi:dihydroorotate dehydrogenase (quinone) [mine drainage metagenome]|uniref:Dihydroorotate dehydrogenase (Quinone) n=1 Tax=mine drainage metagenome TaxID=410659 RepID=A0A1J5R531_9ZZZZ